MSPRPGQDPNDPKFLRSVDKWKNSQRYIEGVGPAKGNKMSDRRSGGNAYSQRQSGKQRITPEGFLDGAAVDRDRSALLSKEEFKALHTKGTVGGSSPFKGGKSDAIRPPTAPANVQTAWNAYTNPPAGTGGLKPTREMAAQFQQYGLTNQSANTRIGGTLPDGSIKGDRNQDGRFGISDFILPRTNPAATPPAQTQSKSYDADTIMNARRDLYGIGKKRSRGRRIDADSLAKAMPFTNR